MRVLGISGSLRRDSHNSALLRAAGLLVEAHGAGFEVFAGLKMIPPYDEDDDIGGGPPAVARLRQAIADADALLFATPEYNSSIPGVLKNAVVSSSPWVTRTNTSTPTDTRPTRSRRRLCAIRSPYFSARSPAHSGHRRIRQNLQSPESGDAHSPAGV